VCSRDPFLADPAQLLMALHRQTLVAATVDGTLLNGAAPFADDRTELSELIRPVALALASTHTLRELVDLQETIEHRGALIAEDGALLAYHDGWMGLKEGELRLVRRRRLRLIPLATPDDGTAPTVSVRESGRGRAVHALLSLLRRRWRTLPPVVGLGSAASDASLLAACDRRFILRDEHGTIDPALSAIPGATVLDRPGIEGWIEMLERLDVVHSVRSPRAELGA